MPRTVGIAWFFVTIVISGCSQTVLDHPSPILDRGPHQGAVRPIAGEEGFIEVVTEPVRDAPRGSPKFRVAVYFLDSKQTAPIGIIPTDISINATWSDAPTPQTVHLTNEPVPGDPAGAAKFVAPPAEHPGEPSGTLSGKLGDRTITATL